MNYIPELCPFKDYEKKKGIMLIIHSNPDPWMFMFTAEGLEWNVQYYKQISLGELRELLDPMQYSCNTTFGEILNNHNLVKMLLEHEKICSWDITDGQAVLHKNCMRVVFQNLRTFILDWMAIATN